VDALSNRVGEYVSCIVKVTIESLLGEGILGKGREGEGSETREDDLKFSEKYGCWVF